MIKFIVDCIDFNPVPYKRTTQRQKYTDAYRRYLHWKTFIVDCFKDEVGEWPEQIFSKESKEKIYVDIQVYYKDKKHGDSDNVAKSINDAIFENDKYVAGSYDFFYDKQRPRVEVIIEKSGEYC